MADLTITNFGGILSAYDPRDLERNKFSDGQNFVIDNGSLMKRNGYVKKHTVRLSGDVLGIAFIRGRDRELPARTSAGIATEGEVVIIGGTRAYTTKW